MRAIAPRASASPAPGRDGERPRPPLRAPARTGTSRRRTRPGGARRRRPRAEALPRAAATRSHRRKRRFVIRPPRAQNSATKPAALSQLVTKSSPTTAASASRASRTHRPRRGLPSAAHRRAGTEDVRRRVAKRRRLRARERGRNVTWGERRDLAEHEAVGLERRTDQHVDLLFLDEPPRSAINTEYVVLSAQPGDHVDFRLPAIFAPETSPRTPPDEAPPAPGAEARPPTARSSWNASKPPVQSAETPIRTARPLSPPHAASASASDAQSAAALPRIAGRPDRAAADRHVPGFPSRRVWRPLGSCARRFSRRCRRASSRPRRCGADGDAAGAATNGMNATILPVAGSTRATRSSS